MRMSDWSSDVCSSDLTGRDCRDHRGARRRLFARAEGQPSGAVCRCRGVLCRSAHRYDPVGAHDNRRRSWPHRRTPPQRLSRSEEHTSELQSLMRISYAVFCLKKKTTKKNKYSKSYID